MRGDSVKRRRSSCSRSARSKASSRSGERSRATRSRRAALRRREPLQHALHRRFAHRAEGGELAARDRDQTRRRFGDLRLARHVRRRRLGVAARDERPHAGPDRADVVGGEARVREGLVRGGEQVVHFVDRHDRLVDLVREGVGGADHHHVVERAHEHATPVGGDSSATAPCAWIRSRGITMCTPFAGRSSRCDAGWSRPRTRSIAGTGGVHDGAPRGSAACGRPARRARARRRDAAAVRVAQELDHLGVVRRLGAEPARALDRLDDEARVVDLRVVIETGRAQAVLAEVARVAGHVLGRQHPEARRAAEVRESPVDAERGAHLPRRRLAVLPGAEQERQRLHEIGVHAQQQIALATRLARDREMAVGEIAQAAVHHLRRATRGARREVAALDQQRAQAARRGVAQHAGADDAAADDEHVDAVALGARERRAALGERPGRAVTAASPGSSRRADRRRASPRAAPRRRARPSRAPSTAGDRRRRRGGARACRRPRRSRRWRRA